MWLILNSSCYSFLWFLLSKQILQNICSFIQRIMPTLTLFLDLLVTVGCMFSSGCCRIRHQILLIQPDLQPFSFFPGTPYSSGFTKNTKNALPCLSRFPVKNRVLSDKEIVGNITYNCKPIGCVRRQYHLRS